MKSAKTISGRQQWRGITVLLPLVLALAPVSGFGQEQDDLEGKIIRRVDIEGLKNISEAYTRRVIKTHAGDPYRRQQISTDLRELLQTRRFWDATADAKAEDGEVVVTFTVLEKPTIVAVDLIGNKHFADDVLYELTPAAGDVIDLYDVRRGRDEIERKYKEGGFYYAEVTLDEAALQAEGRVVYRINEGPRVKVRHIRIEGNRAYPDWRLRPQIRTQTYFWIFRKGAFDEEVADRDAIEIQRFYRDEGYLDARVGYRLEFDDVSRSDVDVIFVVEEGERYHIAEITIEGNTAYDTARLREEMQLEPGDYLRDEALREDVRRIGNLYGEIGYVDAYVDAQHEFLDEPRVVALRYTVTENKQFRIGRISIRGNQRTKDEVVRRELRFYPGELFNTVAAREAEQRIRETYIFGDARITPLPPEDDTREALVEVQESDQIQFLVGVGVSTDSGVIGTLTINNRNFDLYDWPRTSGEFFRGQSFRGDGQRLRFQAEPGTEVSRFRIDFTEPYLLDRPLRFDTSFYLFQRGRDGYDEERLGFLVALSKRFERGPLADWAIEGALRVEGVTIDELDPFVPSDIRDARGNHLLTSAKFTIVRDTTDSRMIPSRGYRFTMAWEQVGALGGDLNFGRPSIGFTWYKTMRTDIFDRKSVFGVRADAAWIVGDAPVFERYYGGGFGSVRGFAYRGISPRKGIFDNRVGGNFMLLTGAEYSVPLYGKTFRGVTFVDMGTVEEDFKITDWRVSVGVGLRIQVDFFGPVPIVLDFGFPIASDDDDDTQVFNFSFGASF